MSRIERPRVNAGETTSATDLNNTYDDYSQAGALDQLNTRDGAFDLVHFSNAPILINSQLNQLGNQGMLHSAPTTLLNHTASLLSPVHHVVQDSTGTETIMNLSASPWTLAVGDVLRVYWDLSVYPGTTGSPWNNVPAMGKYAVPQLGSAGNIALTDGLHCWAAYLEWDITSAGLTGWTPVPGQGTFAQAFGADKGAQVANTTATTLISAWTIFSLGNVQAGQSADQGQYQEQGWFGTHGMYAHQASNPTTVYGLRLVLTGLLHPAHVSSASPYENVLLYDINVSGTLTYKGGRITAVQMRGD
jgi:hypothetical protein